MKGAVRYDGRRPLTRKPASFTWCLRGKTPKAFTLIELLVVIAVIALLMAVLLPVLGRVRKQAKSVVCRSNLRQWGIGFSAYAGDHDGRMPGLVWGTPGSTSYLQWVLPLETYTADYEDILLCPTARIPTTDRLSDRAWSIWLDGKRRTVGSYGYNAWLPRQPYNRVGGHAEIPVVFDCRFGLAGPEHYHDPPEDETHGIRRQSEEAGGISRWVGGIEVVCLNRHSGGINMLFRDWSVRKVGIKENWTLKWHSKFDTSGPWTIAGGVQPDDWPQWMRRFKDY